MSSHQMVHELKKVGVQFPMIIVIGILSMDCGKESIIHGGSYASGNGHSLNTFYIYDFVSMEDVGKHALASIEPDSKMTANYYFTHNANIPSHSLQFSANIQEAKDLIGQYSINIKYAFISDQIGTTRLVNCVDESNDILCDPRKLGM